MFNSSKAHSHSRVKNKENKHIESFGPMLSELYEEDVVCLKSTDTVFDAAKLMLKHHIGDIIITEVSKGGKSVPVGIITDRDIVISSVAKKLEPESVRLSEVMQKKVVTATENSNLADLVQLISDEGISRLPIVDDSGELKGILTSKRLFQFFARGLCELSSLSIQQQKRKKKTH